LCRLNHAPCAPGCRAPVAARARALHCPWAQLALASCACPICCAWRSFPHPRAALYVVSSQQCTLTKRLSNMETGALCVQGVGAEGAAALGQALGHSTSLVHLQLGSNPLGDGGGRALNFRAQASASDMMRQQAMATGRGAGPRVKSLLVGGRGLRQALQRWSRASPLYPWPLQNPLGGALATAASYLPPSSHPGIALLPPPAQPAAMTHPAPCSRPTPPCSSSNIMPIAAAPPAPSHANHCHPGRGKAGVRTWRPLL